MGKGRGGGVAPDVIILRMIQDIAIDGPAASGKTVVGRQVAQRLDWWFLDTGVMYRAVTWLALERGVSPEDAQALGGLAEVVQVKPVSKNGDSVEVAGRRVGPELRESRVDNNVSNVSRHPAVRRALVEQQRNYAAMVVRGLNESSSPGAGCGIVMIGRDIGTVVLPDAGLKVYLTASSEERARRRWREMRNRGQEIPPNSLSLEGEGQGEGEFEPGIDPGLATVLREIQARDAIDSSRDDSPLRPAADAWQFDTTGLSIEEAVEAILRQVECC